MRAEFIGDAEFIQHLPRLLHPFRRSTVADKHIRAVLTEQPRNRTSASRPADNADFFLPDIHRIQRTLNVARLMIIIITAMI